MTKSTASATAEDKVKVLPKNVPRSVPAGGRWWKQVERSRSSSMKLKNTKAGINRSWKRKEQERQRRKEIKEFEKQLQEMKEEKREEEKRKRSEKRKRKAENSLKNTKMQPIKNLAKLKKMNKKQLRSIKKTRVNAEGNVELVGIYQ